MTGGCLLIRSWHLHVCQVMTPTHHSFQGYDIWGPFPFLRMSRLLGTSLYRAKVQRTLHLQNTSYLGWLRKNVYGSLHEVLSTVFPTSGKSHQMPTIRPCRAKYDLVGRKNNRSPGSLLSRGFAERWRPPTLPHCIAVPSAQAGLTSLFGMGRGGTPPQ